MARVLLIDDDDTIRSVLKRFLERDGYTVTEAADGNKGIAAFREQSADVVITDIIMDNRDGLETIVELRKLNPELKIIAMSGGGFMTSNACLDLASKFGAVATLKKPFLHAELL